MKNKIYKKLEKHKICKTIFFLYGGAINILKYEYKNKINNRVYE